MVFNSASFLIFFPIVFIAYWFLSRYKIIYQNIFLLIASYIFYGWWDYRFLILIFISTLVDYSIGINIGKSKSIQKRKLLLYLSLITNLGILGFFKYFNFFIDSLQNVLNNTGLNIDTWSLNIILPVGISFYTFQTMSYTIDIYKEKIKPVDNFIQFAAFVSFFPQLVAGPIERASNLLPQFDKKRKFLFETARVGLAMIVYGFFKKLVIADRLAIYVNQVFSDVSSFSTTPLLIATFFFAIQIYCDFSGYSLIARGIAKLLGFELMLNFRRPYLSTSIPDFWRNWHISLSTWFRDYVYVPLGGNRKGELRTYINFMIVFLVSGLWHGANWTFVVWGGIHGIFQVFSVQIKKVKIKYNLNFNVHSSISIISTFMVVCLAWIFFRAETISEAFQVLSEISALNMTTNIIEICAMKGPFNLLLSFLSILLLFVSYRLPFDFNFKSNSTYTLFNVITILLIIILGVNGKPDFIYFQF